MSPQSLIGNLKKNRHEGFKKLLLFLKKKNCEKFRERHELYTPIH